LKITVKTERILDFLKKEKIPAEKKAVRGKLSQLAGGCDLAGGL
jgi:hypothetical protein